jgi:Magnesium chelatase, subunit ChlI
MLARRLTTILPDMTLAEAIETPRIPRVAGETGAHTVFVTPQPCGLPRHTIVRLFAESWRRSRTLSRPAVAYWWAWLSG